MPPKDCNLSRLFFKTENGEYQPIETEVSLEDCAEIVSGVDSALNNPEYFKGGEIIFKMSRKESKRMKKVLQNIMPRYFTNNWRKMHHIPMERRRGSNNVFDKQRWKFCSRSKTG